jgi:hypothetical protein
MSAERFGYVEVTLALKADGKLDLKFGGIELDDLEDFLNYLGTEEGQDVLADGFAASLVQSGVMTQAQIEELLAE